MCIRDRDWSLWVKLALVGQFGYIHQPLGIYHNVEESVSRSERPADEFFTDAKQFLRVFRTTPADGVIASYKMKTAWACSNEFAINVAGILSRRGYKLLAIKILLDVRVMYLSYARHGRLDVLIRNLLLPQWIKKIYWRSKK